MERNEPTMEEIVVALRQQFRLLVIDEIERFDRRRPVGEALRGPGMGGGPAGATLPLLPSGHRLNESSKQRGVSSIRRKNASDGRPIGDTSRQSAY